MGNYWLEIDEVKKMASLLSGRLVGTHKSYGEFIHAFSTAYLSFGFDQRHVRRFKIWGVVGPRGEYEVQRISVDK